MKFFNEKLGSFLLVLIIILSGSGLFFEDQVSGLVSLFSYDKDQIDYSGKILNITYLFSPKSLNPYTEDPAILSRLNDVYEGLVFLDENFSIRPQLAVSYGLINGIEWEMTLRKGVKFHNGKELDLEDVIYSLDLAKKTNTGFAVDFFDTVSSYEKVDDTTIKFITHAPDPLFLNKLSKIKILPANFEDFDHPIGTGPYQITDSTDFNNIIYTRNENYWGNLPYFGRVQIKSITGKNDRVDSLINGETDFLVDVPPDAVNELQDRQFKVDFIPSLEVGFVMFNLNDRNFAKKEVRKAIANALNKESFLDLAMGYAKPINQFIPNGVFGYNPDIIGFDYDSSLAEKELSKIISSFEKLKVSFYYPENLKLLGQYFKDQLIIVGIDLNLNSLTDNGLQEGIMSGKLSFYYMGWRNDSGDALPFLKSIIHSKTKDAYGIYNGGNYKNTKVDQLIEKSETNLNLKERLEDMQEAMRIVVDEDIIGVPLFETQSIFAYRNNLLFNPRLDSLVYPSQIQQK